ncbi:MAG: alpha/beta hydrolase [Azospirillaceae bacterium]
MPVARTDDGVALHYEEAGDGLPIVFVHEFAGDHRSWEPQMRHFARRYRCLVFAARGYPPSDVPEDPEAYSQARAADDIAAVMDAAGIGAAHVVGLSMGGFATLHFGLRHADRALSLTICGVGYGAERERAEQWRQESHAAADRLDSDAAGFAESYARSPARLAFLDKDPRGWAEFRDRLAARPPAGPSRTMRGVQARRPSVYDLEADLAAMAVPSLVVVGDADDHAVVPSLYLKRTIPGAGFWVVPKTGHTVNLEEPDAFNAVVGEFLDRCATGRWIQRHEGEASADVIMNT